MHKNNFDFLRLLFSVFVVITHSYVLSGTIDAGLLTRITNGQADFSYLGVRGFFIISGFLIFQSLLRSKGILNYYWKRILRLFPALFVVLFLTVLLLPFVYQGDISYWKNKEVWTYLPNNLSLYNLQYTIKGVFQNNPLYGINGSLWTIPYEFSLYIILSILFIFRRKITFTRICLTLSFIFLSSCYIISSDKSGIETIINFHGNFFNLGSFFLAGTLFATYKKYVFRYKRRLFSIGVIFLVVSMFFSFFNSLQFFILPLIIIPFGISSTKIINNVGKVFGDLSYGIYIYSFPIQQTLIHYFRFSHYELFFTTLILSAGLAYVSWHIIEKRALELKKLDPAMVFSPRLKRRKVLLNP